MLRRGFVLLACVLSLGAAAPEARAATVSLERREISKYDGYLAVVYRAGPGERNDLTVTRDGTQLRFKDPGAQIAPNERCVGVGDHEVVCRAQLPFNESVARTPSVDPCVGAASGFCQVLGIEIDAGDGDDRVSLGLSGTAFGGPGDDHLVGGAPGRNRLHGGDGRDLLEGGSGDSDELEGDDRTPFADVLDGGDGGGDVIGYSDRTAPVTVDLSDLFSSSGQEGEEDRMRGFEGATGGAAGDVITGTEGDNFLHGGSGRDRISGLGGNDFINSGPASTVRGGAGNDRIFIFGRLRSLAATIDCGSGADSAETGSVLDLLIGCERFEGGYEAQPRYRKGRLVFTLPPLSGSFALVSEPGSRVLTRVPVPKYPRRTVRVTLDPAARARLRSRGGLRVRVILRHRGYVDGYRLLLKAGTSS